MRLGENKVYKYKVVKCEFNKIFNSFGVNIDFTPEEKTMIIDNTGSKEIMEEYSNALKKWFMSALLFRLNEHTIISAVQLTYEQQKTFFNEMIRSNMDVMISLEKMSFSLKTRDKRSVSDLNEELENLLADATSSK